MVKSKINLDSNHGKPLNLKSLRNTETKGAFVNAVENHLQN